MRPGSSFLRRTAPRERRRCARSPASGDRTRTPSRRSRSRRPGRSRARARRGSGRRARSTPRAGCPRIDLGPFRAEAPVANDRCARPSTWRGSSLDLDVGRTRARRAMPPAAHRRSPAITISRSSTSCTSSSAAVPAPAMYMRIVTRMGSRSRGLPLREDLAQRGIPCRERRLRTSPPDRRTGAPHRASRPALLGHHHVAGDATTPGREGQGRRGCPGRARRHRPGPARRRARRDRVHRAANLNDPAACKLALEPH